MEVVYRQPARCARWTALYYSDGDAVLDLHRIPSARRPAAASRRWSRAPTSKRTRFHELGWPTSGYAHDRAARRGGRYDSWTSTATARSRPTSLFDVDRSGYLDRDPELYYTTRDADGFLSDDERDEDADGLSTSTRRTAACSTVVLDSLLLRARRRSHVAYDGTDIDDADSDGDGVRDGADDQDHDDIPNLMELSRFDASGSSRHGTLRRRPDAPSRRTRTTRTPTAA